VQVVLIHTGVFVAVVQLESPGAARPTAVTWHPHLSGRKVSLWAGSAVRGAAHATQHTADSMWGQLTALSMQALAFFWHRAHALGARHPGAEALQDLLLWIAAFARPALRPSAAPTPPADGAAAGSSQGTPPVVASSSDAAAGRAAGAQASAPAAAAGSSQAWPAGDQEPASLLASRSAFTQRLLVRDHGTQAFLPPVWRPYRLPREILVSLASGDSGSYDFLRLDTYHTIDLPTFLA
jgi:hypothetical protein